MSICFETNFVCRNNTISPEDEGFSGFGGATGIGSSLSRQNLVVQDNIISSSGFNTRIGVNSPSTLPAGIYTILRMQDKAAFSARAVKLK